MYDYTIVQAAANLSIIHGKRRHYVSPMNTQELVLGVMNTGIALIVHAETLARGMPVMTSRISYQQSMNPSEQITVTRSRNELKCSLLNILVEPVIQHNLM